MHSFIDYPVPLAFAHRRGAGQASENTLVAFEIAVTLGGGRTCMSMGPAAVALAPRPPG
jgi:hypothetical protein